MKPSDGVKADVGENRGLRISCGNGGTKAFFYRYASPVTGKLVQVSLGHYPTMSLAEARIKLVELKNQRRQGICPAAERRRIEELEAQNREREERAAYTVEHMCEKYLRFYIEDRVVDGRSIPGARSEKGQREVRRMLHVDVYPELGSKSASEVKRGDIVSLTMKIVARGANVQAGSVLRELLAAYEFSIGLGRFDDDFVNPALAAKTSLRRTKIKLTNSRGTRILSDQELAQLLDWLPGSSYTSNQKNVIRVALWTGCRTGEICIANWRDIDLQLGTWHIRKSKTATERFVHLPIQAINFLRQLKLTHAEFLFPSQRTNMPIEQKQLTEQAWRMRCAGTMLDIEKWTPHDLRRSVRTGLSRLGCPSVVAEAVLGHSRKGILPSPGFIRNILD